MRSKMLYSSIVRHAAIVFGASFATFAAAGCASSADSESNPSEPEVTGTTASLSFDAWQKTVPQEDETGYWIVNGDQVLTSVDALHSFYEEYVQSGALIVHRANGADAKWNSTQKLNITYCVSSSSFGSRYNTVVNAMASATATWAGVANIKFVRVSAQDSNCTASNNNVVFDVRQTSTTSYLARAFFPNDPRSSRNILISTSAFGNTSPYTLAGILRHELGHTIGFRHEHTRPEAGTCFEDNNWRSLTTYDSASVMHYPQCNGSNNGDLVLTSKDRQGAAALYGAP